MEMAEAAFAQHQPGPGLAPAPSSVRMAFLIAMPDPAHPHPYPPPHSHQHNFSTSSATDSGGRPSISSSSEKGKERDPSPTVFTRQVVDEDPELPYLEFGIAEVPVRPSGAESSTVENEQVCAEHSENESEDKRGNGRESSQALSGQPGRRTS